MLLNLSVKFFPKDVIKGKAEKPGDKFTAFFLTGEHTFFVEEGGFTRDCFFATLTEEPL